jgi:hypothetical protein
LTARDLRRTLVGVVFALLVQFLLGMAVNLFVKVPTNHPGSQPAEYFSGVVQSVSWAVLQGPLLLLLHSSLGLLLVVGAVAVVVMAWPLGGRLLRWTTVLGALFVVAAGFNGGSFLNYHEDFSSMLMAALFALGVACYVLALYALKDSPPLGGQDSPPRGGRVRRQAGRG